MGNYIIGIGGTGARCIEAVTHLAAAGLLPDDQLYVLFVDPDRSNGNLNRTQVTLEDYLSCQEIDAGDAPLFQTPVRTADPNVWSPFDRETSVSLGEALAYNDMRGRDAGVADLFDVLYSEKEKNANLGVGFRGHPSIGAAVFARSLNMEEGEPWATFRQRIDNDVGAGETVRIFLMGSIFGGTGASGIPTISKLIKEKLDKEGADFRIGSALALPYFSFNFEGRPPKELKASSGSFIPNTQSALRYYHQKQYADVFDRLYVLGNESLSAVENASLGGRQQENEPHFVELLSALAAADFFRSTKNGSRPVSMLAHGRANEVGWEDLPYDDLAELSDKLVQLTRFAFAFLSTYAPAIEHLRQRPEKKYAYPWFVDFFDKKGVVLGGKEVDSTLSALESFSEKYLRWMARLHLSSESKKVNLLSHMAFSNPDGRIAGQSVLRERDDFQLDGFAGIGADQPAYDNGLHWLWTYLCQKDPSDLPGIGAFVQALYEGCRDEVVMK